MTAKFLIRIDDACHTMDRRKWQMLEDLLDTFGVKPIVAVVPDNQDPELMVRAIDSTFWDKVRSWQKKGWTIAMHGYRHVMHYTKKSDLVLPFYDRSEFAGLPYDQQAEKIRASAKIFYEQDVEPKVWIAPAHCFDWTTLEAVRNETHIRIISDGIARGMYFDRGFYWIPQQLWALNERNSGLWTVCLHPDRMSREKLFELRDSIGRRYLERIVSLNDCELIERKKTGADWLYDRYFWAAKNVLNTISKVRVLVC